MREKIFVLLLFIPLASLSFSTGLVFADPASDASEFNEQGVKSVELGNYEEAISYFDKALQIEPESIRFLKNKGLVLMALEEFYEAWIIYDKILEIDPNNTTVASNYYFSEAKMFKSVDGVLEITIRDSHGNLIGYFQTTAVSILDHDRIKNEIEQWPVTKIITRNGQDFEVVQKESGTAVVEEFHTSNTSNFALLGENMPLMKSKYQGIPLEKGDSISLVFTIFRPIE